MCENFGERFSLLDIDDAKGYCESYVNEVRQNIFQHRKLEEQCKKEV